MRWWMAIAVCGMALLAVVLARHRRDEPKPKPDTLMVVRSSLPSPSTTLPTQRVESDRPPSPVPAGSAAAPRPAEDAPSWLKADPESEPRALYTKLRKEPRDPGWAPVAEAAIRSELVKIPYVGGPENSSVRCASTICEIEGSTPQGLTLANANVAEQALQDRDFRDALQRHGLLSVAGMFTGGEGTQEFTLYYKRNEDDR